MYDRDSDCLRLHMESGGEGRGGQGRGRDRTGGEGRAQEGRRGLQLGRVRVGLGVGDNCLYREQSRVRWGGTYFHTHMHARQGCKGMQFNMGGQQPSRERASR